MNCRASKLTSAGWLSGPPTLYACADTRIEVTCEVGLHAQRPLVQELGARSLALGHHKGAVAAWLPLSAAAGSILVSAATADHSQAKVASICRNHNLYHTPQTSQKVSVTDSDIQARLSSVTQKRDAPEDTGAATP